MKRFILIVISLLLVVGCENKEEPIKEINIFDINWTRQTDVDIETIRFGSDGSFSYFYGCGNPVDDSDLCETYTISENKREIKLNCDEEEIEVNIKIEETTEEIIKLNFNGEIRIFEKEK